MAHRQVDLRKPTTQRGSIDRWRWHGDQGLCSDTYRYIVKAHNRSSTNEEIDHAITRSWVHAVGVVRAGGLP
jgi:hypothetical protein